MKKRLLILFLSLMLLLVPLASSAETVVTSFYPVWLIARNLTADIDGITLANLTDSATGCLHDYTLQNSDMAVLSGADVLLINGAGMEPFLPVITRAYPDLPLVDASEGIVLLETDEDGEYNAHIWLDPQNAIRMAENLTEGLIRCLPDREEALLANLTAFRGRIGELRDAMRLELGEASLPEVLIFHEALPYFAQACDLPVLATVGKEPEDDLSPSALARVMDLVRSADVLPLILKSTEEDRSCDVLAAETGAPVCELDTLVTGPADPPADYYETVMMQNLRVLTEAGME